MARFNSAQQLHVWCEMRREHVPALKQLALMGALNSFADITSRRLGDALGVSQQAASMIILKMAEDGLIERQIGHKGQRLMVSDRGTELLRKEYLEYKLLFEPARRIQIHGTVFSGLGEGRYYISQPKYKQQFIRKLLFEPYEGTLNLRVAQSDMPLFERLTYAQGIRIDGFVSRGRTFGDVKCFLSEIQGIECSVILPVRTHYTDVMEVIAKESLRARLSLRDGDVVEVNVDVD
jgi:riboflavin kinase